MSNKKIHSPIIPLADKVVITPDIPEYKTTGGIIVPDMAKKVPETGLVVAAGKGTEEDPVTVKPGDRVMYAKNIGNVIVIEEKTYLIMKEETIYGILT